MRKINKQITEYVKGIRAKLLKAEIVVKHHRLGLENKTEVRFYVFVVKLKQG